MKIRVFLLTFIMIGNIFGQDKNDSWFSLFNKIQERQKSSIKRASRKIKIPSLNEARFGKNEAELRIWNIINIFGIYWVECFILRKENDQMKASYIVGFNQPKKFRFKNHSLNDPKNGWQNLNNYLRSNGIEFDLNLTIDKELFDGPEGEEIIIEARGGEKYKMYWYPKGTKTADGKRVQQLCTKLVEEFNLAEFSLDGSKYERLKCTY